MVKKLEKWISLQNKKLKDTYCVCCKKPSDYKDMCSKTIKNKVKSLKTKFVKCKHDNQCF